jgi:hypothetical protein
MTRHTRHIQQRKPQGRLAYYQLTLPPELIQRHVDAGRTEVVITEHLDGLLVTPVTPEQVVEMRAGR